MLFILEELPVPSKASIENKPEFNLEKVYMNFECEKLPMKF